jgi:hypothetical protein
VFLLWGWATKNKTWDLGNGYSLLCATRYFHLYYILRFTTSKRYFLMGDRRSEDRELSREDAANLLGSTANIGGPSRIKRLLNAVSPDEG